MGNCVSFNQQNESIVQEADIIGKRKRLRKRKRLPKLTSIKFRVDLSLPKEKKIEVDFDDFHKIDQFEEEQKKIDESSSSIEKHVLIINKNEELNDFPSEKEGMKKRNDDNEMMECELLIDSFSQWREEEDEKKRKELENFKQILKECLSISLNKRLLMPKNNNLKFFLIMSLSNFHLFDEFSNGKNEYQLIFNNISSNENDFHQITEERHRLTYDRIQIRKKSINEDEKENELSDHRFLLTSNDFNHDQLQMNPLPKNEQTNEMDNCLFDILIEKILSDRLISMDWRRLIQYRLLTSFNEFLHNNQLNVNKLNCVLADCLTCNSNQIISGHFLNLHNSQTILCAVNNCRGNRSSSSLIDILMNAKLDGKENRSVKLSINFGMNIFCEEINFFKNIERIWPKCDDVNKLLVNGFLMTTSNDYWKLDCRNLISDLFQMLPRHYKTIWNIINLQHQQLKNDLPHKISMNNGRIDDKKNRNYIEKLSSYLHRWLQVTFLRFCEFEEVEDRNRLEILKKFYSKYFFNENYFSKKIIENWWNLMNFDLSHFQEHLLENENEMLNDYFLFYSQRLTQSPSNYHHYGMEEVECFLKKIDLVPSFHHFHQHISHLLINNNNNNKKKNNRNIILLKNSQELTTDDRMNHIFDVYRYLSIQYHEQRKQSPNGFVQMKLDKILQFYKNYIQLNMKMKDKNDQFLHIILEGIEKEITQSLTNKSFFNEDTSPELSSPSSSSVSLSSLDNGDVRCNLGLSSSNSSAIEQPIEHHHIPMEGEKRHSHYLNCPTSTTISSSLQPPPIMVQSMQSDSGFGDTMKHRKKLNILQSITSSSSSSTSKRRTHLPQQQQQQQQLNELRENKLKEFSQNTKSFQIFIKFLCKILFTNNNSSQFTEYNSSKLLNPFFARFVHEYMMNLDNIDYTYCPESWDSPDLRKGKLTDKTKKKTENISKVNGDSMTTFDNDYIGQSKYHYDPKEYSDNDIKRLIKEKKEISEFLQQHHHAKQEKRIADEQQKQLDRHHLKTYYPWGSNSSAMNRSNNLHSEINPRSIVEKKNPRTAQSERIYQNHRNTMQENTPQMKQSVNEGNAIRVQASQGNEVWFQNEQALRQSLNRVDLDMLDKIQYRRALDRQMEEKVAKSRFEKEFKIKNEQEMWNHYPFGKRNRNVYVVPGDYVPSTSRTIDSQLPSNNSYMDRSDTNISSNHINKNNSIITNNNNNKNINGTTNGEPIPFQAFQRSYQQQKRLQKRVRSCFPILQMSYTQKKDVPMVPSEPAPHSRSDDSDSSTDYVLEKVKLRDEQLSLMEEQAIRKKEINKTNIEGVDKIVNTMQKSNRRERRNRRARAKAPSNNISDDKTRNYATDLSNQLEQSRRDQQLMKMQEMQAGQQHTKTFDTFWGKPGAGAPLPNVSRNGARPQYSEPLMPANNHTIPMPQRTESNLMHHTERDISMDRHSGRQSEPLEKQGVNELGYRPVYPRGQYFSNHRNNYQLVDPDRTNIIKVNNNNAKSYLTPRGNHHNNFELRDRM
ncbi:hypothetical protein SNEBB_000456 [Seison nebaliae]|nr:hypothetical protein SNEBB_000456 [Seison nebaliae]